MISKADSDKRKLFVLDTNVCLHDAGCIRRFEEHDLAIPITVLEELDNFKKGHGDIHFQARQFLRSLDELTGDLLTCPGAKLGDGLGSIRVVLGHDIDPKLRGIFLSDSPDHRIVDTALRLQHLETQFQVILVTKDTNLRMKAKALGVPAQDYNSDKVESKQLYMGKRIIDADSEVIDEIYRNGESVDASQLELNVAPNPNENFVLRNGSKSALATYRKPQNSFLRVEKTKCYGVMPRNAEQSFALKALMDDDLKLVTLAGKAGTGKTILALAAALHARQNYRQILLARPVVPLSNRDLGFLPGDISAKLDPYMQPLHDNLSVIKHQFSDTDPNATRISQMLENEKLVIAPLAYIRGRSLQRIFFIVDEAQNLTPLEVKTIITRAGEGTKIVFTGDIHQIDHPYLDTESNGLTYLISRMKGQNIYSHITLEKGERSELADLATDLL